MFGLFNQKKESDIEKLIKQDGIEHATQRFSEVICEMLKTREYAYQFILEEVEAASGGNNAAMKFAEESGILPDEYIGAMENSMPEIDGANGPQQFLLHISSQLLSNPDLMVKFRTKIAENVMKKFQLGKYKPAPSGNTQEALEEQDFTSKDNGWIDTLIRWANESNLNQLNILGEPNCPYTGFPRDPQKIQNLEFLHLTNSKISYLPPELGKLKRLTHIFLDGNNITTIPKELCYLPNLVRLDIDDNNIKYLPPEIKNLTALQVLSLRNNNLQDLPIEMLQLRNLRKLDLRDQPINLSYKESPLSDNGVEVLDHFYSIVRI